MNNYWRHLIPAGLGFAVCWIVCFVESNTCYTAWGGMFTIVIGFLLLFVYAGLAVVLSLLVGLIFLIPPIRKIWLKVGYLGLFFSIAGMMVMANATKLGLRTEEPISKYRIMPFGIWCLCLFAIVFPIVNIPWRFKPAA